MPSPALAGSIRSLRRGSRFSAIFAANCSQVSAWVVLNALIQSCAGEAPFRSRSVVTIHWSASEQGEACQRAAIAAVTA
jgi:hypothetical protein